MSYELLTFNIFDGCLDEKVKRSFKVNLVSLRRPSFKTYLPTELDAVVCSTRVGSRLTLKHLTHHKNISKDKHFSLFWFGFNDEDGKFYNVDIRTSKRSRNADKNASMQVIGNVVL
jgi:hypothetical protein